MSESHFFRRRWKLLVNIVTVLALVGLAYALRHQISDTMQNLTRVNAVVLLLMLPLQAFNYYGQAQLYRNLFALLGDKINVRFLYRLALELNLVNNAFPTGGVSGFSYVGMRMRTQDVRAGRATLVHMMKMLMLWVSFEAFLFVGLFLLALDGKASQLMILIGGSLATLLIVVTIGFGIIIGSKKRINGFFTFVTRLLNKLIQVFRPKHPETIEVAQVRQLFTEFHNNYMTLKGKYRYFNKPVGFALLANLCEVLTIYVVYIAFGHWVNPGAVILAYAVANIAGLISVLPGGVGVYEALMTAVMAAGGIPPGVSLPVTVMYRILNMAIQLPPGYYFYHEALNNDEVNGV